MSPYAEFTAPRPNDPPIQMGRSASGLRKMPPVRTHPREAWHSSALCALREETPRAHVRADAEAQGTHKKTRRFWRVLSRSVVK